MKSGSTLFLKLVIIAIAVATLVVMIKLPQTEGRAASLTLVEIYSDPFIIYGYISSIPFFIGLYQVIKLLGFIERGKTFSKNSVNALRNIRNCALTIIAFIIGAAIFIIQNHASEDDPAGFIALCILISLASATVAATSSVFSNLLQKRTKK